MYNLAERCMQLKPAANTDRLMGLMIGILGESTEVRNVEYILFDLLFLTWEFLCRGSGCFSGVF